MRKACQELLLSHAPDQTTAREDEFDAIYGVLGMAIRTGASSGALYVSGLPGTGKTTLVREVVRELKKECEHDGLPPFLYLEINGLHLPKPENAYEAIWKAATGESVVPRALTPARICKTLASEYEHGDPRRRPMILLVLDEMDFLVTGKSVVLYNILEWQAFAQSKLIVVGIANTMDLPERLEQKVRSRLGTNRLIFSSYTASQLERIVRQRLAKQLSILSADAIQICCKYVAHASGDARQALTLCRRAVEVALERLTHGTGDGRAVVTSEDMQTAQAATSVSAPLIRLRDCRKFECVFLIALRMEIKRTDKEDASFESVLDRFAVLCNTHSLTPVPRLRDLLLLCDELSRSGILRQSKTKSSRYPKLTLRCSPQEIYDVFLAHPIGRQLLN
jgi:origin recognition complex subunit 1